MVSERAGRILAVTGGTGFIGGSVLRSLLADGWRVRALVRSSAEANALCEAGLEPVIGSLEDTASLALLVDGVYAVIHCAGAVRGATRAHFYNVNVDGVSRLAAAAAEQKTLPRFLLLSSLAARVPELSFYAASKRAGEAALAASAEKLQWNIFRPPAVYGPGDRELLPLFQIMARGFAPRLGSSSARVSLLYVEDLVRAISNWLAHEDCPSRQLYELHDGKMGGYLWSEIAEEVGKFASRRVLQIRIPRPALQIPAVLNLFAGRLFGYAPMLTPGKIRELYYPDWVCDNQAVSHAIAWHPQVVLAQGIKRTLAPANKPNS